MTMEKGGLAKLVEECGEVIQIAAKKMAYMDTDTHPDGAGSMRDRLEDELADVAAIATFVVQKFGLNGDKIARRAAIKLATYQQWDADKNA